MVEWYLLKVDTANARVCVYTNSLKLRFDDASQRPAQSRTLLQLTLIGIIATFTVLLFSCQTAPRPIGSLQPRRFDATKHEREVDQLYIRRNDLRIKNNEAGSSTGSIWADSREPRNLLVDASPSKEGQTITVMIPEDLQFNPAELGSEGNGGSSQTGKKTTSTKSNDGEPAEKNSAPKLTDPYAASPAQQLAMRPIKSFKMQIVGFEPTGDVYLRGVRKFSGGNGEEHTIMLLAKVPRRQLSGFELDARDLTDVAVNEDSGGKLSEYSASGWDEMVSRRLAGFTPDLNSELATLDQLRDEIKTVQNSLRDQAQANEAERERIRKERARMNQQASAAPNSGTNPAQTASNGSGGATAKEGQAQ